MRQNPSLPPKIHNAKKNKNDKTRIQKAHFRHHDLEKRQAVCAKQKVRQIARVKRGLGAQDPDIL